MRLEAKTDIKVQWELEDDRSIVFVLNRATEAILLPWQDAYELAEVLDRVIADARDELDVIDLGTLLREQGQIKLNTYRGLVALCFDWTDRIRYTWRSASMLRDALKITAQNVQYRARGILLPNFGARLALYGHAGAAWTRRANGTH